MGSGIGSRGDEDLCRCVVPCEVCQKSGSVQNEGPTWEAGADDDDDGHDNDDHDSCAAITRARSK